MNILMYEHAGFTGLSFYTLKLSEHMADLGCSVHLLTTNDSAMTSDKIEIIRELLPMKPASKRNLSFIPWLFNRLYVAIYNSKKRREVCERINPDILHLQLTVPLIDQYYIKVLAKKVLTVMTVHDVRRHKKYDMNNLKIILKKIYEFPHALIVHTESNKRQLVGEFMINTSKISLIPHGIESIYEESKRNRLKKSSLNVDGSRKRLLFIGKIRPDKGLDLLINAMPLIIERYPETTLCIAGSMPVGDEFKRYDLLIKRLGVSGNVDIHLKWIDNAELSRYYMKSDTVVLPYRYFASQSGVLMDAYKYEKPVVVTNIGSLGETVSEDKTGIVVAPESSSIARGIIELLSDKNAYEQAVQNMRNCVKTKYSWNIAANKTYHVYRDLLRRVDKLKGDNE